MTIPHQAVSSEGASKKEEDTNLIEVRGQEDLTERVKEFKDTHGIKMVLAFSGGADDENPMLQHLKRQAGQNGAEEHGVVKTLLKEAEEGHITEIVEPVLKNLKDFWGTSVAILTGGTKWGVPSIAARAAKRQGFKVIGAFPLRALQKGQALGADILDLRICVHPLYGESTWGDEASVYTKVLDAVIVIGGNAGTMVEVTHLLKSNEAIVDRFLKEAKSRGEDIADIAKGIATAPGVKRIIPIHGTGGTADKLRFFPGKALTMRACLPNYPIMTGAEAFNYIFQSSDELAEYAI